MQNRMVEFKDYTEEDQVIYLDDDYCVIFNDKLHIF